MRLSVARASSGRPVEGVGRILMLARVIVIIISLSYHHMNFDHQQHQHCDSSYHQHRHQCQFGSAHRGDGSKAHVMLIIVISPIYGHVLLILIYRKLIFITSYHIIIKSASCFQIVTKYDRAPQLNLLNGYLTTDNPLHCMVYAETYNRSISIETKICKSSKMSESDALLDLLPD